MSKAPKHYDPPIQFDRLSKLIRAVDSGCEVDTKIRAEILTALNALLAVQHRQKDELTPGGRVKAGTRAAANLVHLLHTEHGVKKIAAAASAALFLSPGDGGDKGIERVSKAYRDLKKHSAFGGVEFDPEIVEHALLRLNGGNIPGAMAVCLLSQPFDADQLPAIKVCLADRLYPAQGGNK